MSKRSFGLFSLMVMALFVIAACADPQQPTATTVPFDPSPGAAPTATTTSNNGTTVPQPTDVPFVPDPAVGQALFATNCTACHSTGAVTIVGPGLGGVAERAGSRVPGESADDYIRMSIQQPVSFVVDGFPAIMPQLPLSSQDVENLLAYLKTLQ